MTKHLPPYGLECGYTQKNPMTNFKEFIDYVFDFYGPDGLYPLDCTKEQIAYATLMYLDKCAHYQQQDPVKPWTSDHKVMVWGDGDSLDRERVRDFMIEIFKLDYKETNKTFWDRTPV